MRGLPELLIMVDDIYGALEESSKPKAALSTYPVLFFEDLPALRTYPRPVFTRPLSSRNLCPYSLQDVKKLALNNKDAKPSSDFSISFDVSAFKPEEISVKVIDRDIIVEAKHEEREDEHGYISRQFTRKCILPDEYDPDTISTYLNAEGKMTIKPLKPKPAVQSNERIIPIKRVTDEQQHQEEDQVSQTEKKKKDSEDKIQVEEERQQ